MFRRKETILMFGAGMGAQRAYACLRHRCRVAAFVDNDPTKHGSTFLGKPVIGPADLPRYPDLAIHVASMYADQIYRQLTVDLGVSPARVVIVRRPILEGAYEVSSRTYVVLGALAALAVFVLGTVGYLVRSALIR